MVKFYFSVHELFGQLVSNVNPVLDNLNIEKFKARLGVFSKNLQDI